MVKLYTINDEYSKEIKQLLQYHNIEFIEIKDFTKLKNNMILNAPVVELENGLILDYEHAKKKYKII